MHARSAVSQVRVRWLVWPLELLTKKPALRKQGTRGRESWGAHRTVRCVPGPRVGGGAHDVAHGSGARLATLVVGNLARQTHEAHSAEERATNFRESKASAQKCKKNNNSAEVKMV